MEHPNAAEISSLLQQGILNHQDRKFAIASRIYKQILELDPNNADALNLLGVLNGEMSRFHDAVRFLESAIRLKPAESTYRNNLGNTFLLAKEPLAAIEQLKEATRLNPRYVEAYCNLGKAYETIDKIEEAKQAIKKALRIDPKFARAQLSLAQLEVRSGKAKRGVEEYRKYLMENPNDFRALVGVLFADKVQPGTPEVRAVEQLHKHTEGMPNNTISLLKHALGKAYDDLGRYEEAIKLIVEGKKLERQPTDMDRRFEWGAKFREVFTREFLAERQGYGLPTDLPVFIVGMPRSGTTLTEQIVASHPKAYGGGELPHISRVANILSVTDKNLEFHETEFRAADKAKIQEVAQGYLTRLTEGSGKAIRVTDKAPLNVRYLGLMALMFPNCHIIHCKRDPIDTCVSIFMQKFNRGHEYSHDLRNLGQYYREYLRMVEHWKQVMPGQILEVSYEDSVADTETQARKIIDFIGLKWDDACLNFQTTKRSVATASQWQVRQPVYQTSVQRWRRYQAHIGPLIEELSDLVQKEVPASAA